MPIRLRNLSQGALLHVVVALLAGPMKADQIARKTGKSQDSVQRALAVLDNEFGLVTAVPDGRWPVWSLRDTSQLALDLPHLLEVVGNPGLLVEKTERLTPQIAESTVVVVAQNQSPQESFKLPLLPVTPQIAESLSTATGDLLISQLTRLGATPDQAARAINAALKRKETTPAISQRIARLAEYALGHRTIQNPGQWALDYIAAGCALPVDVRAAVPDYSGYRPYLATNGNEGDEADETDEPARRGAGVRPW